MDMDFIGVKNDEIYINNNRYEISKLLMEKSSNIKNNIISTIAVADLKLIFDLYDYKFFGSWFKNNFKGTIKFSLSKRMSKSAGLTLCPKNLGNIREEDLVIEIRLGVNFFFQYNAIEGTKKVCGVKTKSGLEAMLLVFEHELCHVIEFVNFGASSCKQERFKSIANNLFGHTESYHALPTNQEIIREKLGFNVGELVAFEFNGELLRGILYRINKRGTVMVRDKKGTHLDKAGNRYTKYYVPYTVIKKAN